VHQPRRLLRAESWDSRQSLAMQDQFPLRIDYAAAHFSDLLIGQLDVAPVLDVVAQGACSRILLAIRQLFDLAQSLFKE
jgi:hypothetical protein